MGAAEVEAFLTHLAVNENVAASTHGQASLWQRLAADGMPAPARQTCPELDEGDLDFAQRQVLVRDDKGEKDRVTIHLLEAHYDICTVQELLGHKACPEPVEGT